jgi:hypothetical protein
MAPAAGAGVGGDGGFAPLATGALSATTALPLLAGDAFSPVRARVLRVRDSSDGAAAGAGAGGDGGFAPLAAGALAATSVLPPWIRVISARLERVIRGGPATTSAYEPFGDPSAASALGFSIVDALALIATLGLRLLVRIETCKYTAHEPHYLKHGF